MIALGNSSRTSWKRLVASDTPCKKAGALGQLAVGARQNGRFDDALALLLESLPLWRSFGDRAMIARDLRRLARVLAHLERPADAALVLSASEAVREEVGHWESLIGPENAEILDLIRGQLADDSFSRAWQEGRTISVEEAIAIASPRIASVATRS